MMKFIALSLSDVVFILLINVKMPTIVGISIFMSRINFVLFDLIFYVPSTIFQLNREGSSWVEPVLS